MTQLKSRPFQIFLAARLLLTALGLGIYALGLMKPLPDPVVMPLHQYQVPATGLTLAFFGVWERFDVLSYIQIAAAGYYNTFVSVFYPLLPALLRVFAPLLGGNLLFTGLLISNVACLLALYLFDDLLTRDGFEQATTNRALTNLMFWPQAVFLLVGYTESIFLLLCLISFWAARRGWWWVAGLAGLAASLTHFQGVVLGAVLVWEYLRQNGWRPTWRAWPILLGGLPLLGFLIFWEWRTWAGFPPMIYLQSAIWGRTPIFPGLGLLLSFQHIFTGQAVVLDYFETANMILLIAAGLYMLRRLPSTYVVYYWIMLGINLSTYITHYPLSSQMRFALALFPAYIILAEWGSQPKWRRVIMYTSLSLWLFFSAIFAVGAFIG